MLVVSSVRVRVGRPIPTFSKLFTYLVQRMGAPIVSFLINNYKPKWAFAVLIIV